MTKVLIVLLVVILQPMFILLLAVGLAGDNVSLPVFLSVFVILDVLGAIIAADVIYRVMTQEEANN